MIGKNRPINGRNSGIGSFMWQQLKGCVQLKDKWGKVGKSWQVTYDAV